MVKWLAALSGIVWLCVSLVSNVVIGTSVASSLFVVGLLVIIAANVQPKQDPADDANYVPDADLFEDFDDPYAEPEPVPGQSPVRVNPKRKARA
jgi:hypothetical protein